jgi:tetratricopeptide (TPR) repeat protein
MSKLTVEEIRKRFEMSKEFNEIFDAFEQALEQRLEDIDLYKQLFWNHTLTPDELCLFGEKLAKEFQPLAYDTYMWLAEVFEVTYSMYDNYELALEYYMKASSVKPSEITPYLNAADCYEQDLNIPPVTRLIEFIKKGAGHVDKPKSLYEKLVDFYEIIGNDEMKMYYRRKYGEGAAPSQETPPAQ